MPQIPLEVSVEDAKRLMDSDPSVLLIDVREPEEYEVARIEGSELVPMGTISKTVMRFEDREEPLLFLCHHGVRSLQVAAWLRERGIENAQSIQGGIDAWSRRVDSAVPRY